MTRLALDRPARATVLGLRQNLAQSTLLVVVNALVGGPLVGGTLGQERAVLPLLANEEFGLDLYTSSLTYILAVVAALTAASGLIVAVRMRPRAHT